MYHSSINATPRSIAEAEDAAIAALLRCYCREIAEPAGDARVTTPAHAGLSRTAPFDLVPAVLRIALTMTKEIVIGIDRARPLQGYRFLTAPWLRIAGPSMQSLGWDALADHLIAATESRTGATNPEIKAQIANSVAMTAALLEASRRAPCPDQEQTDYLRSEAGLPFGHAFHPTPKAREGTDIDAMVRYSPEAGQPFDLDYFSVAADHLRKRQADGASAVDMMSACLPVRDGDRQVLPVHPVQARMLRADPRIARALDEGWLRDLGTHPRPFHATSSVRTVIGAGDPWFLKLSLAIRMTNCVRKNAAYELDGAVAVTDILSGYQEKWRRIFPCFRLLAEPASLSVDAVGWTDADRTALIEGFGVILRQSLQAIAPPGSRAVLAGALFSPATSGPPLIRQLLDGRSPAERVAWIGRYAALLVPPVLHALFHDGVVFEPHLQNVVVSLLGDEPEGIYLRDYEGVKLTARARPSAMPNDLSDTAKAALRYDDETGWRRVAYCLFVNHLGEAMRLLGDDDPQVEAACWAAVATAVAAWRRSFGTPESEMRLGPLLAGGPLPAKTMLLTRFQRRRDRDASYVDVAGPFATC